jgi:hypothetical protein
VTESSLTSMISGSPAVVTAMVALAFNHRGFVMLDKRFDDTHKRIDDLRTDTHRRLDSIESDLLSLTGTGNVIEIDHRLTRLEERIGSTP